MEKKSFPFEVDESSDVPLWVQLKHRLIYLIESGYYRPGEQLPTVRGLAAEISINYNTVNKAYLSLVSDGYIESTRGRGAFVRDLDSEVSTGYAGEVDTLLNDCISGCRDLGLGLDDIQQAMARRINQMKYELRRESSEEAAESASSGGLHGRLVTIEIPSTSKAGA